MVPFFRLTGENENMNTKQVIADAITTTPEQAHQQQRDYDDRKAQEQAAVDRQAELEQKLNQQAQIIDFFSLKKQGADETKQRAFEEKIAELTAAAKEQTEAAREQADALLKSSSIIKKIGGAMWSGGKALGRGTGTVAKETGKAAVGGFQRVRDSNTMSAIDALLREALPGYDLVKGAVKDAINLSTAAAKTTGKATLATGKAAWSGTKAVAGGVGSLFSRKSDDKENKEQAEFFKDEKKDRKEQKKARDESKNDNKGILKGLLGIRTAILTGSLVSSMMSFATSLPGMISGIVTALTGLGTDFGGFLWRGVTWLAEKLAESASALASEGWEKLKTLVGEGWEKLKSFTSESWSSFKEWGKGLIDDIASKFKRIGDEIWNALAKVVNGIGKLAGKFGIDVPEMETRKITEVVKEVADNAKAGAATANATQKISKASKAVRAAGGPAGIAMLVGEAAALAAEHGLLGEKAQETTNAYNEYVKNNPLSISNVTNNEQDYVPALDIKPSDGIKPSDEAQIYSDNYERKQAVREEQKLKLMQQAAANTSNIIATSTVNNAATIVQSPWSFPQDRSMRNYGDNRIGDH